MIKNLIKRISTKLQQKIEYIEILGKDIKEKINRENNIEKYNNTQKE